MAGGFSLVLPTPVARGFSLVRFRGTRLWPRSRHPLCPSENMFPGRPGHLRTFDYIGYHRYFLTLSTFRRHTLFTADEPVSLVLLQFRRAGREQGCEISGYCFMPDHAHLLVATAHSAADFLRFVRAAKQYSGFYYRRRFGARLWQPCRSTIRSSAPICTAASSSRRFFSLTTIGCRTNRPRSRKSLFVL